MKTLFWLSAGFILYAYLGYPLVLRLLSVFRRQEELKARSTALPHASLLISAYNEEAVIEEKILNTLSLNYPSELLEIIVISDDSVDRTNEIVRRYADRGVALNLVPGRIGKTRCLNETVPCVRGGIVVFSDANSLYDRDALAHLAAAFGDGRVGLVTGHTRYCSASGNPGFSPVGLYAKLETAAKKAESSFGSCVGADGAIFAVRKELYRPLLETDINDLVIPLQVVRQGYRCVLEERAFCVEKTAGPGGEFRRQVRITNRTLRALFRNIDLFNPFRSGLFAFELFSHKAAKLLAPFFAAALVVSTAALWRTAPVYGLAMLAELVLVLLAVRPAHDRRSGILSRLGSVARTFLLANAAVLAGWFQFLKGETYTTWSPAKR